MKKYYIKRLNIFQPFLLLFFYFFTIFSLTQVSAQSITMIPGITPANIVRQGDSVNLTLNIRNPIGGTDYPDSYLVIISPENWKVVFTDPVHSSSSNNVYTIAGLNISPGVNITITLSLQALCNASVEDEIIYDLYSSADVLLGSVRNTDVVQGTIQNIITPYLVFPSEVGIPSLVTVKGIPSEREWEIIQRMENAHIKSLKIEIPCNPSEIEINDILYKVPDGNGGYVYESIDVESDRFVKTSGGYIIYVDAYVINRINGTDKIGYGQSIEFKEVITYHLCDPIGTFLTYEIYYGNMEEWCPGLIDENNLRVSSNTYQPWIEWVTSGATPGISQTNGGIHILPANSTGTSIATGRGMRLYRIANYGDSDQSAVLRDLRVKFASNPSLYAPANGFLKAHTAYFADFTGTRIPGTPDIPINRDGIPGDRGTNKKPISTSAANSYRSYQDIICIDMAYLNGFQGHSNIPLIDYDGDGHFDDLPIGSYFYLAVEYDIQYQNIFTFDPGLPAGNTKNGFLTLHRTMVDLYYKNNCGEYEGFGWGDRSEAPFDETNYPTLLNPNDGKIYATHTNTAETVVNVGVPIISLDGSSNVRPEDKVVLKNQIPSIYSTYSRAGFLITPVGGRIPDDYVHTVEVTLPEGFIYDTDYGVKIRASNLETGTLVAVDAADVNVAVDNDGKQVLTIRNKIYYGPTAWIYVGMQDNNTSPVNTVPRADKDVKYSFYFNMQNEPPVLYSYFTVPLNYNQIFDCDRIELAHFSVERRTFGWTNKTKQTLADINMQGLNLKSAGPYDRVSHLGYLRVKNNVTLASDERFLISLSYKTAQDNPYFIFPNEDTAVIVRYKAFGASFSPDIIIPVSHLIYAEQTPDYKIFLDLTDYIDISGGIGLNGGDSLIVEFLTETTLNIPNAPSRIDGLEMEAYTEILDLNNEPTVVTCGPISDVFTLFDYGLKAIVGGSGSYQLTGQGNGEILRWQLNNGSSNEGEVFINEFRPNSTIDSLQMSLNGLFIIDEIVAYTSGSNTVNTNLGNAFASAITIDPRAYTVTYNEGKTLLSIKNDSSIQLFDAEVWASYTAGYYFTAKFRFMGALNPDLTGSIPNVQYISDKVYTLDYPSSGQPVQALYSSNNSLFIPSFDFFKYSLTPSEHMDPVSTPVSNEAVWGLLLNNQSSNQTGMGGILPNSWLSLECGEGVLGDHVMLYAVEPGLNDTLPIGPFIKVTEGKYWIKLGDLAIQGSQEYIIKSSFQACKAGSYKISAQFSMANEIYPADPWTGYPAYNTTGVLNASSIVPLALQVRNTKFRSSAAGSNPSEINSDGLYTLCEPFTIDASFHNISSETVITNLQVKALLSTGLEYNCAYQPLIKVGESGTFQYYNDVVVDCNNGLGYAVISLPPSLQLDSHGSSNADITVRFQMIPGCGFNGGFVRLAIIGEKGCGEVIPDAISTSNYFPVIRLEDSPVVVTHTMSINGHTALDNDEDPIEVRYDMANNGKLTVQIHYTWAERYSPILYSYIDFPEDLEFEGILENLSHGSSYNAIFVEETISIPGYRRIKAQFHSPATFVDPISYLATLTFTPQNLERWDCIDYSFYNWLAVTATIRCESLNVDCEVYEIVEDVRSYFRYKKLKDLQIEAVGNYENSSSANITVYGEVASDLFDEEFSFDLVMRLYYEPAEEGGEYIPVDGVPPFTAVITNENLSFVMGPYIVEADAICGLTLIIWESDNPYMCEDIIIPLLDKLAYKITNDNIVVCQSPVPFTIGDPPLANYSYSWSSDNPGDLQYLSNPSVSQPDFTPGQPGIYNYTVHVLHDQGCTSETMMKIIVNELPTFTVSDTVVCTYRLNLEDLVINISNNSTVSYYENSTATEILSSPVVNVVSDTAYYIRSRENTTGCISDVQKISVELGTYPVLTPIEGPNKVCVNGSIELINSTGEGIWRVSNPSVIRIISSDEASVRIEGVSKGHAYVSYIVGTHCQTVVTFKIKVTSRPSSVVIGF